MRLVFGLLLLNFAVGNVYSTEEGVCTADGDCGNGELKSHFVHTEDDISKEDLDTDQGETATEIKEETNNKNKDDKATDTAIESKEDTATKNNVEEQKNYSTSEKDAADTKTAEEKVQEVDGILSGCTVTNEDGQLYKYMMLEAGYVLNSSMLMKRHHCLPEEDIFMKNGFFQTIGQLDGEEVAIVAMMPSQALQAHAHDTDEVIQIRYGELTEMMWPDGPGQPETKIVKEGQTSYMHSGFTHAIFAGPEGVVYHEKPETFFERKTWFAPT